MKIPRVIRPEIVVEYKGIKGFIYCLYAIVKVGIKQCKLQINLMNVSTIHKIWIIPKYKIKQSPQVQFSL